ncbi:hypothetical protein A3I27_03180 [Candidatus Giovannonibacteria bacterium RIFCSPLOWO2_02_FULL_43_11b]|uniref:Type 4 fimbrial biogenesis protein PilX N-terminal domain-containing protein n=1 Tax=Candidatus Giovannonibacteria bacterium RIFCSPHIGHO2_12_FULL_43_15 TaxID=1798341 RepID=A0A1F5WP48_9BACT|nr:MAG: hypothetical protein A3B97_01640 [Candidatus Giovannonibacteria bacterium RIFCSPHIGHO2_02_FULL_43_32]OGF77436.1 MAG: hypothetical protein A3F23_01690 [Candidatus Giovannonibacteria bacterium RIFCSPHIGHO2_12_FULL_43_15]OGF89369.1 MAG: hypothetical protein A3I27_03180 [Candidatus Giovannonibacteria bacterium RIFCSPLOWO2_02_FULL_43_11b]OGF92146.1 MAG: hypothetical protein A3H04_00750 [Candidatus Giovannonibacteria bacterium RIFCSPLOWO2_12_FULL_43_11c]
MIYSKACLRRQGIALLLSVIIVSIILAVSVGVSNIVSTEISLSNTSRQSQLAFYASDAGVDCAIYWDTVHDGNGMDENTRSAFAISDEDGVLCGMQNQITCNGYNSCVGGTPSCVDASGNPSSCDPTVTLGKSEFTFSLGNGSCVKVIVNKKEDYTNPLLPDIEATIHADGFSSDCNSTSPRVFQRSLETTSFGD